MVAIIAAEAVGHGEVGVGEGIVDIAAGEGEQLAAHGDGTGGGGGLCLGVEAGEERVGGPVVGGDDGAVGGDEQGVVALTAGAGGQERQEYYYREKPHNATTLFYNLNTTGMQTFVRQGWPSMMPAVQRGIMRSTRSTSWSHWRFSDVTMATSVTEPSLLTMNSATTRP